MSETVYAIIWRDYDIHLANNTIFRTREAAEAALLTMRQTIQHNQIIDQLLAQDMEAWHKQHEKTYQAMFEEFRTAQYLSDLIHRLYKEQQAMSDEYLGERREFHKATVPMPVEIDIEWDTMYVEELQLA
jgi:hypothetical protein